MPLINRRILEEHEEDLTAAIQAGHFEDGACVCATQLRVPSALGCEATIPLGAVWHVSAASHLVRPIPGMQAVLRATFATPCCTPARPATSGGRAAAARLRLLLKTRPTTPTTCWRRNWGPLWTRHLCHLPRSREVAKGTPPVVPVRRLAAMGGRQGWRGKRGRENPALLLMSFERGGQGRRGVSGRGGLCE